MVEGATGSRLLSSRVRPAPYLTTPPPHIPSLAHHRPRPTSPSDRPHSLLPHSFMLRPPTMKGTHTDPQWRTTSGIVYGQEHGSQHGDRGTGKSEREGWGQNSPPTTSQAGPKRGPGTFESPVREAAPNTLSSNSSVHRSQRCEAHHSRIKSCFREARQ